MCGLDDQELFLCFILLAGVAIGVPFERLGESSGLVSQQGNNGGGNPTHLIS